jgi:nicotinamidase-related amidase
VSIAQDGTIHPIANPYPWPFDGDLRAANTALVIIDMQTDFCGPGGYVDKMGYDLSLTRAPIEPIKAAGRLRAGLHGDPHPRRPPPRPEPTCRPTSAGARSRSARGIGDPGPCGRILVRGEPGWEIIPELAPLPARW